MAHRPLISCDELAARLGAPDLRIVDASWHLPATGRDAHAEYLAGRVPGASFYDIDVEAAPSALPHMVPDREAFATGASRLGLSPDDDIVIYDSLGLFSAARVRWVFRHYGARRVNLLDGGLPAWQAAGLALESGAVPAVGQPRATVIKTEWVEAELPFDADAANVSPAAVAQTAVGQAAMGQAAIGQAALSRAAVAQASDVLRASVDNTAQIIDARSRARFTGEEKEARPNVRSGHIPNSLSLPFTDLLDAGRLRSNEELGHAFAEAGVSLDRPIITSCGSGVTAAVIALALECLGRSDVQLYDGSWAEWGSLPTMPVEQGPAVASTSR